MLIRNAITLDRAANELFSTLMDLDYVASCVPGARLLPANGDATKREGEIDVNLGVMRFRYGGSVALIESDETQRRAVFAATASETGGDGAAQARLSLRVDSCKRGSELSVETDLQVTGPVAMLGQGLIEDFAQQMMEDFGRSIGGNATATSGGATPAIARPRRLPMWSILFRVARRRLTRLWQRDKRAPVASDVRVKQGATVDLLIVGSGSGALTAALAAREAGLDVLIVEKAPVVGGGTAYSGGVVWAPCNHVMRRKGIDDSPEDALAYLEGASDGRGDEALARRYVSSIGKIIEQVEEWTGIPWIIWPGQPDYYSELPGAAPNGRAILQHPASAYSVLEPLEAELPELAKVRHTPHMDLVPGFQSTDRPARESWLAGRAIIGGLWKAVLERAIPYRLSTPLVELIVEEQRVCGGIVLNPDGSREAIRARRGVLLNTGGFDWNTEMARRYLPGPHLFPQTPPTNTGDGHKMAMSLGAAVALMDKAVFHPAIRIPGEQNDGEPLYRMFNAELAKPHGILINRSGRRFASESAYFGVCDAWNMVDQRRRGYPNVPSYLVVDNQFRAKFGLPGVAGNAAVPDWIATAPTIEALAEAISVDVEGLREEIEIYNRDCSSGVDTRFDRGVTAYERYWGDPNQSPNPTMGTIIEGPFYAFEVHPSHAGTRGGVLINPDAQVIRADGTVIDGLYACGNTAANLLFGAGYGSGASVGSSMVFGYLAAQKVIAG